MKTGYQEHLIEQAEARQAEAAHRVERILWEHKRKIARIRYWEGVTRRMVLVIILSIGFACLAIMISALL